MNSIERDIFYLTETKKKAYTAMPVYAGLIEKSERARAGIVILIWKNLGKNLKKKI